MAISNSDVQIGHPNIPWKKSWYDRHDLPEGERVETGNPYGKMVKMLHSKGARSQDPTILKDGHGNFRHRWIVKLVGGLEHFLFSIIYGMSSFPLTNIFRRG